MNGAVDVTDSSDHVDEIRDGVFLGDRIAGLDVNFEDIASQHGRNGFSTTLRCRRRCRGRCCRRGDRLQGSACSDFDCERLTVDANIIDGWAGRRRC